MTQTPTHRSGRRSALDPAVVRHRLAELAAELELGRTRIRELDTERDELQKTILRIEGAILVLQELTEVNGGAGFCAEDHSG